MKREEIQNIFTSYLGIGISFLIIFLRAKFFSAEDIGFFSYILSIGILISSFLNIGIPRIILRYYTEFKKSYFLIGLLSIQILIYSLFYIIIVFINKVNTIDFMNYIFLMGFLTSMISNLDMISMVTKNSVYTNFLQKIFLNITDASFVFFSYFMGWDIIIYMKMYILIKTIIVILMLIKLKGDIFIESNMAIEKKKFFEVLIYGCFVTLNTGSSLLINTIDKIMIKKSIGFEGVGVYTISLTIGSSILLLNTIFSRTDAPKISKYLNSNRDVDLEKLYKLNLNKLLYLGLFIFLILFNFSSELLGIMGSEYIMGANVLKIILLGQIMHIICGLCGNIISLSKYYKYEAYYNFVLIFITYLTNLLFIPLYGIEGAAIATALSVIIINIFKVGTVYLKFKIHPYSKKQAKLFLTAILTGIIINIIKFNIFIKIYYLPILSVLLFIIYDIIFFYLAREETLTIKLFSSLKKWLVNNFED